MARTIVHIANDEKFINSGYNQFEKVAPGKNKFYIYTFGYSQKLIHVKLASNIHVNIENEEVVRFIKEHAPDKVLVILHSLSPRFYPILFNIPDRIYVVWFCFGYEVYNDAKITKKNEVLAPLTLKQFYKPPKKKWDAAIKNFIRPYARLIVPSIQLTSIEKKYKAISKVTHLGSSFKEEYESVCSKIGIRKFFFDFWYYPIEEILDVYKLYPTYKTNMLIGNSSSKSGNHLDIFEKLKGKNLDRFEKIVIPLSYGSKKYADKIALKARDYFADKTEVLRAFMPLAQYNDILEVVGVAIFYNYRQQGLGNIIALLFMGAKIFLSNNNPIFDFLKRNNIAVYSIEDELLEANSLQSLSEEQREVNKVKLVELLNANKLHNTLAAQLKYLKV